MKLFSNCCRISTILHEELIDCQWKSIDRIRKLYEEKLVQCNNASIQNVYFYIPVKLVVKVDILNRTTRKNYIHRTEEKLGKKKNPNAA